MSSLLLNCQNHQCLGSSAGFLLWSFLPLSSGCAGLGRHPWKTQVFWVREKEWALSFPPEVCPFLKLNTRVLHLNFDGQDLMIWGIPWGFFSPSRSRDSGLSVSSVVSADCKPQGLSGLSDHGRQETAACVWSSRFTLKCFTKQNPNNTKTLFVNLEFQVMA